MWIDDFLLIPSAQIKSKKKLTQYENNARFRMEFFDKFEAAMRRYKIENIPDTCNERIILQSMICHGCVLFFKDPEYGDNVFAMCGVPSGKGFNINGDPVSAFAYSKNGLVNKEVDLFIKGADNSQLLAKGANSYLVSKNPQGVLVWENKSRYPFIETVLYFSRVISDTYRTIDVCRKWMKNPFIPVCEESMVASIKEMLGKIENNEDLIPVSTGVKEVTKIDFHDIIGAGDSAKDAIEMLDWYEQKYREKCTMNSNTQVDKKGENLIVDEVHMNDEYVDDAEESQIDYINNQLDFVNEVLGTNMRCVIVEKKIEQKEVEKDDRLDEVDDE